MLDLIVKHTTSEGQRVLQNKWKPIDTGLCRFASDCRCQQIEQCPFCRALVSKIWGQPICRTTMGKTDSLVFYGIKWHTNLQYDAKQTDDLWLFFKILLILLELQSLTTWKNLYPKWNQTKRYTKIKIVMGEIASELAPHTQRRGHQRGSQKKH